MASFVQVISKMKKLYSDLRRQIQTKHSKKNNLNIFMCLTRSDQEPTVADIWCSICQYSFDKSVCRRKVVMNWSDAQCLVVRNVEGGASKRQTEGQSQFHHGQHFGRIRSTNMRWLNFQHLLCLLIHCCCHLRTQGKWIDGITEKFSNLF